jgi:TP901 family phage tail tape measure protein
VASLISTVGIKYEDFGTPAKLKKTAQAAKQTEKAFDQLAGKATVGSKKLGLFGKAALGVGASSSIGAVGVKALGTAIKSTFGPLLALSGTVAGLGTAFNTLKEIDFAKAKLDTLGVASDDLVQRLKLVSIELNGSASIAELAGAGYDVASAGFTNAADAAMILKAATQGATGGFSDINTVGNAATSVLNAYGKSAKDAQLLVDQFIQTQNDGKIIVAEYAANIGKVASVAATMKVPITEVNAAIAQVTAAGVKSEVAFTGMKTALLRLGGEAGTKKLAALGIDIDASTLASEGLLANLKKLEGLDIKALESIFGQEAIQTMAPIIANLEKYEQLIKNQEEAAGAAADAQFKANDTLLGSWKRIVNSFSNLFGEQTELGEALKFTLYGVSAAIDLIGAAVKLVLAPFRIAFAFLQGIGDAILEAFGVESVQVVKEFTDFWNKAFVDLEEDIQSAIKWTRKWGASVTDAFERIKVDWHNLLENIKKMWFDMIPAIYNATPKWLRKMLRMDGEDMPLYEMKLKVYKTTVVDEDGTGSGDGSGNGTGTGKIVKDTKEAISLADQLKGAWENIKGVVADGVHGAIMGLLDGTKSLKESLAGIAKQIASMFIKKAVFSAFGLADGGYVSNGIRPFAAGGYTTKPTMGLVGEAGEDEYVIPASKMAQSMQRYSSGARGEAVIPGTGSSAGGAAGTSSTTVNYSGPILNFNSEEFVPKSAVGQIIATATSQGARAGESKTLTTLRNSRSARSRLGM